VTWNTDTTVSPTGTRLLLMDNVTNNVVDNENRMIDWCRMWTEDPALAHQLMTDECLQWSNRMTGLDAVVGPAEQERFVTAYRARQVNVFTPRVLADAGDRFTYLWGIRTPDGEVKTGLDFNVMRGDRVHENWTFVATRHCDQPDPEPVAATDRAELAELGQRWARLRNGRAEPAQDVVTSDFALFAGEGAAGDATGPAELAALVERRAAPAFTRHRELVVDVARGTVAFLWTAAPETDGVAVGGVDLLRTRAGRVARAWTLTGTRAFRY
jgi:hypothetical protein